MVKTNLEPRSGLSVLAAACVLLLAPLLASGEDATFTVSLSGPETSGDPDGQGEATVTMDPKTNRVDVQLSHSNIAAPTALHIRKGAVGLHGNIVVPLVIESDEAGTLTGTRTSAKPDAVEMILAAPEEYYLVVINEEYPVGALRGPLRE